MSIVFCRSVCKNEAEEILRLVIFVIVIIQFPRNQRFSTLVVLAICKQKCVYEKRLGCLGNKKKEVNMSGEQKHEKHGASNQQLFFVEYKYLK